MDEEFDMELKTGFSFVREAYDWVESGLTAILCVILMFTFVARIVSVEGSSMEPTLQTKDRLLVTSRVFHSPQYKDIVVVTKPNSRDEPLIKRVVATEGQTIDFDFEEGKVYVDGVELDEPYIEEGGTHWHKEGVVFPQTVPEGHVFIMGDNRNDSWDSRDPEVGMVDERYILGNASFRLLPYGNMGALE